MSECFVYVIAAKGFDGRPMKPVKIGISTEPNGRLASIQTSCPFPIGIVHRQRMPDREIAKAVEYAVHTVRQKHRSHGEWFEMTPAEAIASVYLALESMLRVHLEMSSDEVGRTLAWSGELPEKIEFKTQ